MFDFENLQVYSKAREVRKRIYQVLSAKTRMDRGLLDQLKRASLSMILNIAEGTGKYSKADKRNFFTISRGSVYEIVSILDVLCDDKIISEHEKRELYSSLEVVSKMLLGLINSLR